MERSTELKKISVVIPMYNAEKTIARAIYSVINQTYKGAFEIIVVNDGSKDKSADIVREIIEKNPKVKIRLIEQENGGVSKARNTGLKNVSGDYIALLDSDDEWFDSKIVEQINIFESNRFIDFLGASFVGFRLGNKKTEHLSRINFKSLLFRNYFQPSTVLFKREIINKIGYFDENQRYAEEGNFFLRVAREYNCYFFHKNLINFGDGKSGFGDSGLSANLREMEKGELKNLKFVLQQKWISSFTYSIAVGFSLLKYVRRITIVKIKKI